MAVLASVPCFHNSDCLRLERRVRGRIGWLIYIFVLGYCSGDESNLLCRNKSGPIQSERLSGRIIQRKRAPFEALYTWFVNKYLTDFLKMNGLLLPVVLNFDRFLSDDSDDKHAFLDHSGI